MLAPPALNYEGNLFHFHIIIFLRGEFWQSISYKSAENQSSGYWSSSPGPIVDMAGFKRSPGLELGDLNQWAHNFGQS